MKAESSVEPYDRIALFGGSFDPVHCAHLEVARSAIGQEHLDSVIFIPNAQSPLKHRPLSDSNYRVEMLRLAIQREDRFSLDTYEVDRGGVNFTIDTVEYFRKRYKNTELFWIIGEDQWVQLDRWLRIDELALMVIFLVYPRAQGRIGNQQTIAGLKYRVLDAKPLRESSTEIRERCKKRLPLTGLIPEKVASFIDRKSLYRATA